MALGAWCQWRNKKLGQRGSVNLFFGFFFLVNYSLGTGFLAIPFSFFYAGYLAAIPTLLVIVFVSWVHASWVLEVMARAQALESFYMFQRSFEQKKRFNEHSHPLHLYACVIDTHNTDSVASNHPDFRILETRRFETSEMCEVFFHKLGKYIYLVTVIVFSFSTALGMAIVTNTTLATIIPLRNFMGTFNQCHPDAFSNVPIPEDDGCRYTYYFCLMLFGLVVVPLSMMNLKVQAFIQAIFGLLRFLMITMILVYCIVKLIEGGDICQETVINLYTIENVTAENDIVENATEMYTCDNTIRIFNPIGWLVAIPVLTYPFLLHHSIPSFTHPIGKKKYLWQFILCTYSFLGACFLCLGVVVPLWFRAETQESVVFNWVTLAMLSNSSTQLKVLSYYIFLLPPVYICLNYPLNIQPIVNNIYSVFFSRVTRKRSKRCDQLLKVLIRFFAAVIPLTVAFGVSDLVTVLQYAGLSGFLLSFIFPTALQLQSIRICKKVFRGVHSVQAMFPTDGSTEKEERNMTLTTSADSSTQDNKPWNESSLYMTPYSTRILSRPIAVIIIGAIGGSLFLLTIASLPADHIQA